LKYVYWLFYYYFYFYFCRPPEHLQNGYVDEGYMSPRGRPPIQNGGMRQGKGVFKFLKLKTELLTV
jgi:hypothetical protein